jgi:hypothetical protein
MQEDIQDFNTALYIFFAKMKISKSDFLSFLGKKNAKKLQNLGSLEMSKLKFYKSNTFSEAIYLEHF